MEALLAEQAGNWERAYESITGMTTAEAAWVRAYLLRSVDRLEEATYWYQRAVQPFPESSLATEWKNIVEALSSIERAD